MTFGGFYHDYQSVGSVDIRHSDFYNLLDLGVFGEFEINEFSGVQAAINYSVLGVDRGFIFRTPGGPVREDSKISAINFSTHYKFDVNKDIGKGFYLLAGPRISFLLNAETDSGQDTIELYNTTRFAGQLGFGVDFLKHYSFEFIGDYGFNTPFDSDVIEIQSYGIHFNFKVNLESLISN